MSNCKTYIPLSPKDIVRSGVCIGCGSCVAQADASSAQMNLDHYGHFKPAGSAEGFRRKTVSFAQTCPFSPSARNEDELADDLFPDAEHHHSSTGRFRAAYVGYVADEDFRERGSSGGMVSWVATELLRAGLIDAVAHVRAVENPQNEGRFFRYDISRTEEEIRDGAKSRYYPVELSDVLRTIRAIPGRYA